MVEQVILIVDDDNPEDQAAQLAQSFKLAQLRAKVRYAASPAKMLDLLPTLRPDLVLLDHHWKQTEEQGIEVVLQEVRRIMPETRVVVYTGKAIEPTTVVSCVRSGVAEYLTKGAVGGDVLASKLWMLASRDDNSIGKLSSPVGSVQQLVQEADKSLKQLEAIKKQNERLAAENSKLKSADRREVYLQIFRFIFALTYLLTCAGLIWFVVRQSSAPWAVALAFLGCFIGAFLLDRSVSEVALKLSSTNLVYQAKRK